MAEKSKKELVDTSMVGDTMESPLTGNGSSDGKAVDVASKLKRAGAIIEHAEAEARRSVSQRAKDDAERERLIKKERAELKKIGESTVVGENSLDEEARMTALAYERDYRERLRRERSSDYIEKASQSELDSEFSAESEKRRQAALEAAQRERDEANDRSARIGELLGRIDKGGSAEFPSDDTDKETPALTDAEDEYFVSVDTGIKSDILRIEGMSVGNIALDANSSGTVLSEPDFEAGCEEAKGKNCDGSELVTKPLANNQDYDRFGTYSEIGNHYGIYEAVNTSGEIIEPTYPDRDSPLLSKKERRRLEQEEYLRVLADTVNRENSPDFSGENYLCDNSILADTYVTEETVYGREPDSRHGDARSRESDVLLAYAQYHKDRELDGEKSFREEHVPFNKRSLKKAVKRSRAEDIDFLEESFYSELRRLELELQSSEMTFSKGRKRSRELRSPKAISKDILRLERRLKRAIKSEKSDNKRYYAPILTDYRSAKLPKRADREGLIRQREELIALLARRDELNEKLTSLYSGRGKGKKGSSEGRFAAEWRCRRTAYRKQKKLASTMARYHVSFDYSNKLHSLMDEYVNLSGELGRVLYSLRKEKPRGGAKRALLKERKRLKRKLRRIEDDIAYYRKKAITKAKDRRESKRNMILGWGALIVILIAAALVWVFRVQLSGFFASLFGGAL